MLLFLTFYTIWIISMYLFSVFVYFTDVNELKSIIIFDICEPDDRPWWCFVKKVIYRFFTWPGYLPFYFSRFRFLFKQKDS